MLLLAEIGGALWAAPAAGNIEVSGRLDGSTGCPAGTSREESGEDWLDIDCGAMEVPPVAEGIVVAAG